MGKLIKTVVGIALMVVCCCTLLLPAAFAVAGDGSNAGQLKSGPSSSCLAMVPQDSSGRLASQDVFITASEVSVQVNPSIGAIYTWANPDPDVEQSQEELLSYRNKRITIDIIIVIIAGSAAIWFYRKWRHK